MGGVLDGAANCVQEDSQDLEIVGEKKGKKPYKKRTLKTESEQLMEVTDSGRLNE